MSEDGGHRGRRRCGSCTPRIEGARQWAPRVRIQRRRTGAEGCGL